MQDVYHDLFISKADQRVEKWLFMKDPFTLLGIISGYLFLIYYALPNHMRNRKAYNLKNVILVYNFVQIILSVIITYGVATAGWTTTYSWGCQLVDYSTDPLPMQMVSFIYFAFLTKLFDLVDTVFFILRHKQNQVTALHVYHHCATPFLVWSICKYIGGGMISFGIMLNSFVHILMYSYYFLAAIGPKMQKKLAWLKPKLTTLQMAQFWIMMLHNLQILKSDCDFPDLTYYTLTPHVFIFFLLFFNFYKKTYNNKKNQ